MYFYLGINLQLSDLLLNMWHFVMQLQANILKQLDVQTQILQNCQDCSKEYSKIVKIISLRKKNIAIDRIHFLRYQNLENNIFQHFSLNCYY